MELLENLLWSIASKRLCYSFGILRLFYVMGGLLVCNYCICLSQKLECRRQDSGRGVENVCHVCPTDSPFGSVMIGSSLPRGMYAFP